MCHDCNDYGRNTQATTTTTRVSEALITPPVHKHHDAGGSFQMDKTRLHLNLTINEANNFRFLEQDVGEWIIVGHNEHFIECQYGFAVSA